MNAIIKVLKSPWFWLIVLAIAVLLFLRANWSRWSSALRRLFMKDNGDYAAGFTNGAGTAVSGDAADARKKAIEAMVQELYTQITAGITNPWARESAMQAITELNDTERRFAAAHYHSLSRGESMYQAIDNELMWASNVDNLLMGQLANQGLI